IAIYNLVSEIFRTQLENTGDASLTAAKIAEGIDRVIRSIVFEDGHPIIDWAHKSNIEGSIRIGIDDYLFGLMEEEGMELPFDLCDELVEEGLKVARLKLV